MPGSMRTESYVSLMADARWRFTAAPELYAYAGMVRPAPLCRTARIAGRSWCLSILPRLLPQHMEQH